MQFEQWLRLSDGPAVGFSAPLESFKAGAAPDQYILPATCCISALRRGFHPFPFTPPSARRVPARTVEEALTGRPAKRARKEEKDITIRTLKRADVEAVSDLQVGASALSPPPRTDSEAGVRQPRADGSVAWQDSNLPISYPWSFYATLLSSSSSLCLIAVPSAAASATQPPILGCISARLSPASFDDLSSTPTIHILSLVIAPSARRTGLARKLFKEVLQGLGGGPAGGKGQKEVQVMLHVLASNLGAQEFYQMEGLKEVRRVRGYYRRLKDGGNGEALEMRGLVLV